MQFFSLFFQLSFSSCTFNVRASYSPMMYKYSVTSGQTICIDSSIPRTIYAMGHMPESTKIQYSILHDGKQNYTKEENISCSNTFFFGINEISTAKITTFENGEITFGLIGLGDKTCLSNVFISNEVVQTTKLFDFSPLDHQCFFFASYGQQSISFNPSLQSNDLMEYNCGADNIISSSVLSQLDFSCLSPGNPFFSSINITNNGGFRSGSFQYSTSTIYSPFCPSFASRVVTPTPSPDPTGSKIGVKGIIAIVFGSVLFVIIFTFLILFLFKKRKMKVEAITDCDNKNDEASPESSQIEQ